MKVVSDLSDATLNEPCVLSIGNFDGLLGWWIALLTGALCIFVWRYNPPRRN